jgi:outer membrane beta-barrel protein
MKKTRIGLLVAAALCGYPMVALAQGNAAADKSAAAEGEPADGGSPEGATEGGDGAAAGDAAAADGVAAGDGGGGLDDICAIDPEACPSVDMDKEAAKPLNEQIYAVQQIYALRVRRFELNPYWIQTLNDQFVTHPGPGLAVNYYLTNVMAVGLNGNFYRWFNVDSKFNADVRRAARVGVPLNEYDWSAAANFTYVPAYGKFQGFQDFIFHYDAYVVGGAGLISTRPIPVFDPDFRNFQFKPKLAFNAGIGVRIFFNRWFAAMLEVRNYVYNEKLENLDVAETDQDRKDKSTWEGKSSITVNTQAQLGVSVFLPSTFEYRLPK